MSEYDEGVRCSCIGPLTFIANGEATMTPSKTVYSREQHRLRNVPEYMIWSHMKQRCYYTKNVGFHKYGGRGITVDPAWRNSFSQFFADMGPRPTSRHTIERRNNDGPYSPANCYWATPKEQARNRRNSVFVTIRGKRMLLIEACEKYGVSYPIAHQRVTRNGWTAERTFGVGK